MSPGHQGFVPACGQPCRGPWRFAAAALDGMRERSGSPAESAAPTTLSFHVPLRGALSFSATSGRRPPRPTGARVNRGPYRMPRWSRFSTVAQPRFAPSSGGTVRSPDMSMGQTARECTLRGQTKISIKIGVEGLALLGPDGNARHLLRARCNSSPSAATRSLASRFQRDLGHHPRRGGPGEASSMVEDVNDPGARRRPGTDATSSDIDAQRPRRAGLPRKKKVI